MGAAFATDLDFLARHAKIDAPLTILYLGDSLSDFDRGSNHVDLAERAINRAHPGKVKFHNYAVGGETVVTLLQKMKAWDRPAKDGKPNRYEDLWSRSYDMACPLTLSRLFWYHTRNRLDRACDRLPER